MKTLTIRTYKLSDEIREFLRTSIKTEVIYPQILGVVELTLSLYKTFTFEKIK